MLYSNGDKYNGTLVYNKLEGFGINKWIDKLSNEVQYMNNFLHDKKRGFKMEILKMVIRLMESLIDL